MLLKFCNTTSFKPEAYCPAPAREKGQPRGLFFTTPPPIKTSWLHAGIKSCFPNCCDHFAHFLLPGPIKTTSSLRSPVFSPQCQLIKRKPDGNTRSCQVPATLMEPGPAAHVAQGGRRPCGSLRGRQGAAGQSRAAPDAATPPARFWAAARRAAAPRPEQSVAPDTPAVLCVPHAPRPGSGERGGAARGLAARGPRPKPGTIGGGAQSPPCPPPSARAARPAGTWRRGRRSCRDRPALPRRARSQRPSRLRAVRKAGSGVPGHPQAAKSPRPRGELPTRPHTKPTRSAGGAPGPVAPQLLRPAPARARTKFGRRRLPPTPRLPPARAQVPRGRAPSRPAACPMCRRRRFVLEAL